MEGARSALGSACPLHHTSCGPPPPHFVRADAPTSSLRGNRTFTPVFNGLWRRSNPQLRQDAPWTIADLAMTTRKIVLATHSRARGLPTTTTPRKIASGNQREAERRKAHAIHVRAVANKCAQFAPLIRSAAARTCSEARPPFGAHACGTRHRLSPRWLSPRTGFPEDGPRECFARSGPACLG